MRVHTPICPCCQHVFTKQEARMLIKKSMRDNSMCPQCGEELYPTQRSRSLVAGISLVVGLLILTFCLWSGGTLANIGVLIAVAVQLTINYTLRPILYSYQSYQESLFKL